MSYTPDQTDGEGCARPRPRPVRGRSDSWLRGTHARRLPTENLQELGIDGGLLNGKRIEQDPLWAWRGPGYVWRATEQRRRRAEAYEEQERAAQRAEQDAKDTARYLRMLEQQKAARRESRDARIRREAQEWWETEGQYEAAAHAHRVTHEPPRYLRLTEDSSELLLMAVDDLLRAHVARRLTGTDMATPVQEGGLWAFRPRTGWWAPIQDTPDLATYGTAVLPLDAT